MSRFAVHYKVAGFAGDRNITVEAEDRASAKEIARLRVKNRWLIRHGKTPRVIITGTGLLSR